MEKISLEEKLRLVNGVGDWHTSDCNGKLTALLMTDGPHGIRKVVQEKTGDLNSSKPATCFPTASAVASSWNPNMSALMAECIASEALKEDIDMVLGPGVNIKRSPLCGRNFEYYSEDPYLAGKMGTAYVKSMQEHGVGTSLKHFAANSQEQFRQTSNSQVDTRALREIYLSAFETIVKETQPTTIMACYNLLNGTYGCQNKELLTDILRNEWGFEGAVISDWGACIDIVKCLKSGMDLAMPDGRGFYTDELRKALDRGDITEEELTQNTDRIIGLINRLEELKPSQFECNMEAHHDCARTIEEECAVLLKNNDRVLPLKSCKKIIIIGDMASNIRFQGGGSSHINALRVPTMQESLRNAGIEVMFAAGYSSNTDRVDEALEKEALELIECEKDCNIIYACGLTDKYEGEGYDRKTLDIPANQVHLLERIYAIRTSPLIAVTFGGSPMDFGWEKYADAILHMHLGGQAVAEAVADIVTGRVNPSGRLAETIPLCIEDTPAYRYFAAGTEDVEYRESIFVGYRYYETKKVPVRFPFGYGLSYTEFEYSNLKIEECMDGENLFRISFDITNTGDRAGKEVAQLYVLPGDRAFISSSIELKGFCKVFLEVGERKTVTLNLDKRSFSVFDVAKNSFICVSGDYKLAVGSAVNNHKLTGIVSVEGETYSRNERLLFPDYFGEQPAGMDISREQFEALYGAKLSNLSGRRRGDMDRTCSFGTVSRKSLFGKLCRIVVAVALKLMCRGMDRDDPARLMTEIGVEEGALESLISTSGGAITIKLADLLVYNANKQYGRAFKRLLER